MTDSTGTTTRTYDELNRVLTKIVPDMGTSTYAYDIITGVPTGCSAETTTDPKGHTTQKIYDRMGRLSAVTADGATTTYTYYDNGNRQSVIYPDGSREDCTYYSDNLNQTLTNKKADGTVIDTYSYTYDGAHNQTSKTDSKGTTAYTYDSLNRLETVTEPNGTITRYTYDKAGNRLTEAVTKDGNTGVTIYTYNEQNRLLSTTSIVAGATQKVTYTYDNNGNMLTSATTIVKTAEQDAQPAVDISAAGQSPTNDVTFNQYDAWNRLIKTTVGSNTVTNTYNGDGSRVSKTVNGQTTRYLYEYDKVVLEEDGQGNESARNVYGTNLLQRTDGGETYYYMYNGHGDVTALLGTDGQIPATYYYDAFGSITEQTVTGNVYQPFKYAGYQYDDETGLYYLNARYYDSKIARFISEDSYTGETNNPLSLNLYTYCFNNPIIYTDPTGHKVTAWDIIHCTLDEIKAIDEASKEYDIAKKRGNAAGMAAAHQKAINARSPHLQGEYIDSSGYVHFGSQRKDTNKPNSQSNSRNLPGYSQGNGYSETSNLTDEVAAAGGSIKWSPANGGSATVVIYHNGVPNQYTFSAKDWRIVNNKMQVDPRKFKEIISKPGTVYDKNGDVVSRNGVPVSGNNTFGDDPARLVYARWYQSNPGDRIFGFNSVFGGGGDTAFFLKLKRMQSNGIDVTKLSLNQLDEIYQRSEDATLGGMVAGTIIAGTGGLVPSNEGAVEANEFISVETLNSKPLYRVMSEAELNAVKETGKLRGGWEGETYFTDSYYKSASNAQNRLSLKDEPQYIVEFKITNNPRIIGGTTVEPANGGTGGGREYVTADPVEIEIINFQKLR